MLKDRPTGVESPEQIDIDDGFEPVRRHPECWRRKIPGGTANDEIDLAVGLTRRLYRSGKSVVVPHIGGMTRCGAAGLSYFVGRGIELLLCSPDQRDTGAMRREATSDREVDAPPAAGDDRVFFCEQLLPEHFRHVRSSRMKRGPFAANRKPIAGAKTVKVVVIVQLHYYLPEKPCRRCSRIGELHTAVKRHDEEVGSMNRSSFAILVLGSLATACTATVNTRNSPSEVTENSLMQADRDFAVATQARGIDGWMSFYAPDAIRIRYRGNMIRGFDEIRKFDLPNISDTTSILSREPTDAHVFNGGSIGSTTGKYSVVSRRDADTGKELGSGRYVTMWRRDGGRWLVIMDTGYPNPPVAR